MGVDQAKQRMKKKFSTDKQSKELNEENLNILVFKKEHILNVLVSIYWWKMEYSILETIIVL